MKKLLASSFAAAISLAPAVGWAEEFSVLLNGLPAATAVGDSDYLYLLQGGVDKKAVGSVFLRPGNAATCGATQVSKYIGGGAFSCVTPSGAGDVVGPAGGSVDDRIATFDGSTGKLLKDSGTLVSGLVPASRTINAGTGLSGGGDLSTNRTLTLANTAVTPGSYTNANVTIDQQGRITAAANGTGGGGGSGTPAGSSGDWQKNTAGAFGAFTPATGAETFIITPTSLNLAAMVTNETGSGSLVFGTSPILTTPTIAKIANLTVNGLVKTSGSDGTLSAAVAGTDYAAAPTGAADAPLFRNGTGGFTAGTRSGTTTAVVTRAVEVPGTNDCAKWDASGNLTTAGAGCAGTNITATDGAITVNPTNTFAYGPSFKVTNTGGGIATIDLTVRQQDKTGAGYAALTADRDTTFLVGAFTYTIPQAGLTGFGAGWGVCFLNNGSSGNATITTTTSTFKGASGTNTMTLRPGAYACPSSDGVNYQTIFGSRDGADLTGVALLASPNTFTAGQSTTPVAGGNVTGTVTPNANLANDWTYTLTGNITLANPSNIRSGQTFNIMLTQDGTGSRTIGLGSSYKFAGAVAPTWSTAAGKSDILSCRSMTTTFMVCSGIIDVR